MDGVGGVPGSAVRFLGPRAAGSIITWGGFRPNGTGSITIFRGPLASGTAGTGAAFSVTYGATGLYTVTMTSTGWKFPTGRLPIIAAFEQCADVTNTNRFKVFNNGGWDNTNRRFVLAAWQDTAAFAVPSNAANWIDFVLFGQTK